MQRRYSNTDDEQEAISFFIGRQEAGELFCMLVHSQMLTRARAGLGENLEPGTQTRSAFHTLVQQPKASSHCWLPDTEGVEPGLEPQHSNLDTGIQAVS